MVTMMITNWLHFGYSWPIDASKKFGLGWLLLAAASAAFNNTDGAGFCSVSLDPTSSIRTLMLPLDDSS